MSTPEVRQEGWDIRQDDDESCFLEMEWATPQYSKNKINAAGAKLVDPSNEMDLDEALTIINNWRSSHSFPLNTFQVGLRRLGNQVYNDCLVAQRIKRLSSIEAKLSRFPTMTLSQMQDIGGCRAVLRTVGQVRKLSKFYTESKVKHKLHTVDDYIRNPKDSGYRGIHLIYTYYSDRSDIYNTLKIEMQLRSAFQHAWATAVETVGTFVQQALKSSQGEADWLRFFTLMGAALALREKTAPVPDTPSDRKQLKKEVYGYERKLDVANKLRGYGAALNVLQDPDIRDNDFMLLKLNPPEKIIYVTGFRRSESQLAAKSYLDAEREIQNIPGAEAVLVSVDSTRSLRKAYPNYFLDTEIFLQLMNDATQD